MNKDNGFDGISKKTIRSLAARAVAMAKAAYAPYSHFCVGAAVRGASGKVYAGCNVENASYPCGICAERNAIFQAVAAGERRIEAVAIAGGRNGVLTDFCPPCGLCRQTMREFADPERLCVILAKSASELRLHSLAELLPEGFGPDVLANHVVRKFGRRN